MRLFLSVALREPWLRQFPAHRRYQFFLLKQSANVRTLLVNMDRYKALHGSWWDWEEAINE